MPTVDRPLTFGERAVGLTFNPSGDETVHTLKVLYAQIIDILNDDKFKAANRDSDKSRLYSIAITEAQGAQMWAVKAATWKEP
jgi:hypothetical protein